MNPTLPIRATDELADPFSLVSGFSDFPEKSKLAQIFQRYQLRKSDYVQTLTLTWYHWHLIVPAIGKLIEGRVEVYHLQSSVTIKEIMVNRPLLAGESLTQLGYLVFEESNLKELNIQSAETTLRWPVRTSQGLTLEVDGDHYPTDPDGVVNGLVFFRGGARSYYRGLQLSTITFLDQTPSSDQYRYLARQPGETLNWNMATLYQPSIVTSSPLLWTGDPFNYPNVMLTFNLLGLFTLIYLPEGEGLDNYHQVEGQLLELGTVNAFEGTTYQQFLISYLDEVNLTTLRAGVASDHYLQDQDQQVYPEINLRTLQLGVGNIYLNTNYQDRLLARADPNFLTVQPYFPVDQHLLTLGLNGEEINSDVDPDYGRIFKMLSTVSPKLVKFAQPLAHLQADYQLEQARQQEEVLRSLLRMVKQTEQALNKR